MIRSIYRTTLVFLIFCVTLPAWGQQYLYAPQPVSPGQKSPSQEGVLVQEVVVGTGDSLYSISRKFSGHGMYFPQILLFNSIKNPHLIYPGSTLRIPVTNREAHDSERIEAKQSGASHKPKESDTKKSPHKAETQPPVTKSPPSVSISTPSTELSLSDLKSVGTDKNKVNRARKTAASHEKKYLPSASPAAAGPSSPIRAAHKETATVSPVLSSTAGQKLFDAAVKAYRQNDCRTALEQFDRYLAENSGSALAAEATLYKAECYLKLSTQ